MALRRSAVLHVDVHYCGALQHASIALLGVAAATLSAWRISVRLTEAAARAVLWVSTAAGVTSSITLSWAVGITLLSVAAGAALVHLSDESWGSAPAVKVAKKRKVRPRHVPTPPPPQLLLAGGLLPERPQEGGRREDPLHQAAP